jgi:GT2 family glycosyltransferase
VDFCKRAYKVGWKIIHNPAAHVVHLRGGSSPVKSQAAKKKRLPRYFYESRARYYFKHFGRFGLFAANMFWHLGWLVAMGRKLANRAYQPNVCEKQWRDIWTNFTSQQRLIFIRTIIYEQACYEQTWPFT